MSANRRSIRNSSNPTGLIPVPAKPSANRANARKSTGPRTAEGKARASLNAISHGLFCKDLVLPGESQEVLKLLRRLWISSLNPQDIAEMWLVDRIVAANWKLRRLQES